MVFWRIFHCRLHYVNLVCSYYFCGKRQCYHCVVYPKIEQLERDPSVSLKYLIDYAFLMAKNAHATQGVVVTTW